MENISIELLKKTIEEHERRISELEKLFISKPEVVKKELSPREFIGSKSVHSDIHCTLIFAYYIEKYKNLSSFSIDDLDTIFREAKQTVPKNINLNIIRNVQKGYMMESKEKKDGKKSWCLTATGESHVEND